ncbi:MAG: S4 domain-containing protein [Betaproteobacteria bacterium]
MKAAAERAMERVRFDKWLWAARFYRTRSLAAQAIEAGQARIDDARATPSHAVRPGQRVALRRNGLLWEIDIVAVSAQRGGAAAAALLYSEDAKSVAARQAEIARRRAAAATAPTSDARPTKRDRRKLQAFLDEA